MPKPQPPSPYERDHCRKKDLKYVIGVMRAHEEMVKQPSLGSGEVHDAVYVGSLAAGRMLLNFIGLDVESKVDRLKRHEWNFVDDIHMEHCGGKLVDIVKLNNDASRKELLVRFLRMASKSAAHIAKNDPNRPWQDSIPMFHAIEKLVQDHWWTDGTDPFPPRKT
jgi:hypothetical protein